uniref:Uncharacterized protein n=1 Tax=Anopheles arabiensis TaxID=7173 RepID=A0A182IG01_ANOAR
RKKQTKSNQKRTSSEVELRKDTVCCIQVIQPGSLKEYRSYCRFSVHYHSSSSSSSS